MLNTLFIVSVFIFIGGMLKQIFETNAFFSLLKHKHPKTWEELGRPKWNIQFGDPTFRNAVKYIRQRRFSELGDPELERSYKAMRRAERVALFAAAAAAMVVLAEAFRTLQ
jgi:hypothetical protein